MKSPGKRILETCSTLFFSFHKDQGETHTFHFLCVYYMFFKIFIWGNVDSHAVVMKSCALYSVPPWHTLHNYRTERQLGCGRCCRQHTKHPHHHGDPPSCPFRATPTLHWPRPSFYPGNHSSVLHFRNFVISRVLRKWNHVVYNLLRLGFFSLSKILWRFIHTVALHQ